MQSWLRHCQPRRCESPPQGQTCRGCEERLQLARGEQPGQFRIDAGEAVLVVGGGVAGGAAERRGGGVAGGAAERRGGGEAALGVLGLIEPVAVVGDDELDAELVGRGGGQRGAPSQFAYLARSEEHTSELQ